MTKEYQDQMTQKAKDENLNPITGQCRLSHTLYFARTPR